MTGNGKRMPKNTKEKEFSHEKEQPYAGKDF
jgi:hypothetical protein